MFRIGIDCRFAAAHGGLGTYTRSIVSALLQRKDLLSYVLFVRSKDESWLSALPVRKNVTIIETPFRQYSIAEQFKFPSLIRRAACNLLYSPSFNVPLFCPIPFVATVHDLILHRYPNEAGFLKRLAYRFVFGRAVARARCVIAVSETTKKDLVQWYPSSSRKVIVSFPGVSSVFVPASIEAIKTLRLKHGLQKPFLLYVGNCKQHKNVPTLIEAFTKAHLQNVDLLLVSGGKECSALVLPKGVRILSDIDTSDFTALYGAALGLVTASKAEGFGLPMVEAMACRCPVLATTCGSIPEICGSHALLVPPTVDALADGMKSIATDPALRSPERLEAAREWVTRYDWDGSAAMIASVFLSCPPSSPPLHSSSI